MKPFNTNHTFKDIPCIFYPPWWLEELLLQRRHKCPWRSPDSPSTPEQPPLRSSLQCHRRCILILEKGCLSLSWSIIFHLMSNFTLVWGPQVTCGEEEQERERRHEGRGAGGNRLCVSDLNTAISPCALRCGREGLQISLRIHKHKYTSHWCKHLILPRFIFSFVDKN